MGSTLTVPNINPTGQHTPPMPVPGVDPNAGATPTQYSTSWGGAPPTGGPGNYNFGNAMNPQPTGTSDLSMFGPTVSMNPGSTGGNAFGLDPRSSGRSLSELQKYYGEGVGKMLFDFLQSGGGFNSALTQQAVDAQIAAMEHQIQRGLGNLDTQMGETGISPNSSAWALETGDYMSNAVAQENAITAQEFFDMWNQSQNRMTSVLRDVADVNATATANEPGIFDFLKMGLDLGGEALGLFTGVKGLFGSHGGSGGSSGGGYGHSASGD